MVTVIAVPDMTTPISIEPLSPMKIRAGWKLWTRKPAQAPANAADSRAPVVASEILLKLASW